MRRLVIALSIAALPWAAGAAPTWQTISAEPGKRIELDRTSLKRDGNMVQAQGRVVLEKELVDNRSGAAYRVIEAITRYDCSTRSATTLKRIYKKNESEVVREEELHGSELPVRSGTLDDKVLREVCRPPKESATDIAQRANEAGTKLKEANDAMLKKELAKAEAPSAKHISDAPTGEKEGSQLLSIRPNLKAAAMESAKEPPPKAELAKPVAHAPEPSKPTPASKPMPLPAVDHAPSISHVKSSKPVTKKTGKNNGYMLELTGATPAVEQHAHIHWSYEGDGGPTNWAKLDPKNTLCASGTRQSPIDIREGLGVDLEPIRFDYRPTGFRIVDNGHTIQVTPGEGNIYLTGKSYQLVQFHFHRPSEEKIDGRPFDMVVHLVHKADDGQLAVVAVLLERGKENPFIQTLWNYIPLEQNVSTEPPGLNINPQDILPAGRSYYTYMGSLTTPPCSEGVLWLVMKQPVELSQDQLAIFSRLYRHNARPTQPVNGRIIKVSR